MKSFLYLIEGGLTSGACKCAIELINRLKGTNFRPIIITQHKNDFNDYCDTNGIENYHLHYARICSLSQNRTGWLIAFFMRPILNFIAFKRLCKKINIKEICFVHSNGGSIDFGAYLYKKKGIPHFWHIRDFFLFNNTLPPLIKNLAFYMEQNATSVITVSNALRNVLIDAGCSPNKVQTIYDGIEIKPEEKKELKFETRKKLNVACVGQICNLKGQETLIEAICQMTKIERNFFQFDFFGEIIPEFKDIFLSKIKKYGIEKDIRLNGFSNNILKDLRKYDIGVQPSHSEGFSRVTAEYMAAGLCVIAAEEGAIPELIQHNQNGLLYKDFTPIELKNLLIYCYQNQPQMHILAEKAQKDFFNKYEIRINFDMIVDLYNQYS